MNPYSIIKLFNKTIIKSSPENYIRNKLNFNKDILTIDKKKFKINKNISAIAFGKASSSMFKGLKNVVGIKNISEALIISHMEKLPHSTKKIEFVKSSHPYVSYKSYKAGKKILNFVRNIKETNKLIVLVSGGGSAMISYPIENITFRQKKYFLSKLLVSGTPEREVNILRKSLSHIKGGGLAEASKSKEIINLILSDERSHKFDAISSGPTIYSPGINPNQIIKKYNLKSLVPNELKFFYSSFDIKIARGKNKNIENFLIGSREEFIDDFSKLSLQHGIKKVYKLPNKFTNDPVKFSSYLNKKFKYIYNKAPLGEHFILSSGEIQVQINEQFKKSKGGRNQHLTACMMLQKKFDFEFVFLAIGTDGTDYIDGISGAFFSSRNMNYVNNNKKNIKNYIKTQNTYKLHKKLGTLIKSKKTGHNVSDIFVFYFKKI